MEVDNASPQIPGQTDIFDVIGTVDFQWNPPGNDKEHDMIPQETGGHIPPETSSTVPPETYRPGGDWPPEGTTLVPAERITEAIEGMTIECAVRSEDETAIHLIGVECPAITLVITDDGYWTAVVHP